MNNDNITQAAANKAAEEGGLHELLDNILSKYNRGTSGRIIISISDEEKLQTAIAADRASRQVANKAEDEEGSDIRWVADGQIFGRPTATDLLEMAESRLEDDGEFQCCKNDVRVSKFKRIVALVANKAEVDLSSIKRYRDLGGFGVTEWETGAYVKLADVENLLATPPATTGASIAHSDDIAVDRFAEAMKMKMAASRAKGRSGWDDPSKCSAESLQTMLLAHLAKGDPVDIGNFAMMLWNRGEKVASVGASTVLTDERIDAIMAKYSAFIAPGVYSLNSFECVEDVRSFAREVAAQAGQVAVPEWISVDDRMPGNEHCLAAYVNAAGKHRVIRAMYAGQFQIDAGEDAIDQGNCEYNETDDTFYLKAGWLECIDNWDDYSSIYVTEGTVTHWRRLPASPSHTTNKEK